MADAKKVSVEVHIVKDSTKPSPEDPYSYWMETKDNKVGGGKRGSKLTFNSEYKYKGFDIDFELVDETGEGFLFMDIGKLPNKDPDPDLAPMWVKAIVPPDNSCPNREFWPEFTATKVQQGNTTLKVHNANSYVQEFKFAFMFSRTPHQGPYEIMWDPGGTNQNSNATMKSPLVAVLVVVGVIAVAAFAAFKMGVFDR
jgi:hypothetical protein